ncbi:MAG: DUF4038 domain-containing protein [Maricaulaceae bacterium]|jgi:hypothetical protein
MGRKSASSANRRALPESVQAAAAAALLSLVAACDAQSQGGSRADAPSGPPPAYEPGAAPAFPLRVSDDRSHLVDADGAPFLLFGDTAWSLIVQLPLADAEAYLDDRRARGFNTILVNLIEHQFADNAPLNASGEPPFAAPGDYAAPNDAYFDHAQAVIELARERDMLVMLTPSYIGYGGSAEGWWAEMQAAGRDDLRGYGRYLGERFGNLDNIMWVHGGDWNPPDLAPSRAIAEGLAEAGATGLVTVHGGPYAQARDHWGGEAWLEVDNVYTYEAVAPLALQAYATDPVMPFFLMESAYENEHDASPTRLRTQAYHALLSGACGQVFGVNPIWTFDAPGIFDAPVSWREALDGAGSRSMTRIRRVFDEFDWTALVPDTDDALVTSNRGRGQNFIAAARARDGGFALVYMPRARGVEINLGRLAGPRVQAEWRDPASDAVYEVEDLPPSAEGLHTFRPPGLNAEGAPDWLLVLEAAPEDTAP